MTSVSFKGDKLVGRSNYLEWKTNADLFLEINGFMPYIDGTEGTPIKSLYYESIPKEKDTSKETTSSTVSSKGKEKEEKEELVEKPYSPELAIRYSDKVAEFHRNNKRALGALKSIISIENTERFKDKITARSLYTAIKSTFGESSLLIIGRYIDRLIDNKYNNYSTMDEYTSNIQSSTIYLKELSQEIPEPIIAWLLLKGLPSSFDNFASRKYEELEEDLEDIDLNKLVSELIAEEGRFNSSTTSLEANRLYKPKPAYCKHCKQRGHIESSCFIKYPELKNKKSTNISTNTNFFNSKNKTKPFNKSNKRGFRTNKKESTKAIMSAFSAQDYNIDYNSDNYYNNNNNYNENIIIPQDTYNNTYSYKIVLDSGASQHYTPNKEWLLNYKSCNNKNIITANGHSLPVLGTGNIPVFINNRAVIIKGVNYVPNIKTTLLSSKELTNKGWEILFKSNYAKLSNKKYNLSTLATWVNNAYYLNNLNINYSILEPIIYNTTIEVSTKSNSTYNTLDLYHDRLLHLNKDYILNTINSSVGLNYINPKILLSNCDSCYYSKFKRIISREPQGLPINSLEFLDGDILGPFKIKGLLGERYIFTLTDRASRAI